MLIGVDVGTGSARAGVFDAQGRLLGVGKHPVTMWQEPGEIVEQSSDQIWQAVCAAVREAMAKQGNSINISTPEQAQKAFHTELAKYAALVKKAGIQPE